MHHLRFFCMMQKLANQSASNAFYLKRSGPAQMQDLLTDALCFYSTASNLLLTVSDAWLAAVPEHIVDDLFDLLIFVAHYKPCENRNPKTRVFDWRRVRGSKH